MTEMLGACAVGILIGAIVTYVVLTDRYAQKVHEQNIVMHEHLRREHPERGIPFIDLPVQNLVHLLTADHEPRDCPDGTCRRLDVEQAIEDVRNVAKIGGFAR